MLALKCKTSVIWIFQTTSSNMDKPYAKHIFLKANSTNLTEQLIIRHMVHLRNITTLDICLIVPDMDLFVLCSALSWKGMILSWIANGMILVRPSVLPTTVCLKKVCYEGQVDTDQDKPVWGSISEFRVEQNRNTSGMVRNPACHEKVHIRRTMT